MSEIDETVVPEESAEELEPTAEQLDATEVAEEVAEPAAENLDV